MGRWQDQIAVGRWVAAWLPKHTFPQVVTVIRKPFLLLEYCFPGNIHYAPDDYPAGFTAGVGIYGGNHSCDSHFWSPSG
jgi:hypothetical protein